MAKHLAALLFILLLHSGLFAIDAPKLRFEQNKGQLPSPVLYKTELSGAACFIEKNALTWNLVSQHADGHHHHHAEEEHINGHAFKLELLGATMASDVSAYQELEGYSNYYTGKNAGTWASNVKAYAEIIQTNVYPGIDWKIYSGSKGLKYDFMVKPGTSASSIKMHYRGLSKIALKQGRLILHTSVGTIEEEAPIAWQIIEGKKYAVDCAFELNDETIGFELGAYNPNYELIIDPQLVFGTFSGSQADNWGFTATYDQAGNTYSAGVVFGIGYPTSLGAWQQNFANGSGTRPCDIGIIKYSATGQRLYATYLGGVGNEIPQSMIVSSSNELFILGTTGSNDFATTNGAYSRNFKGGPSISILRNGIAFPQGTDLFVSRFSENGTQLLSSTFVGGTANDGLNTASQLKYNYADDARGGIAIDNANNVLIAVSTVSEDFPTNANSFQPEYGGGSQDGIVLKMNENLSQLMWAGYLGGSAADGIMCLELDRNGNAWVAGGTVSLDFPTSDQAFSTQNSGGRTDGFIACIKADGRELLASSYYGTDTYDQIYQIALDRQNRVYVYGQTEKSGNYYRENFLFSENDGKQFVSKFSTNLNTRIWSSTFGRGASAPDITPTAFTVDICGQIFIAGWGGASNTAADGTPFGGTSGLTVTPDAFQSTTDNNDFYFMVWDEPGQSLVFASFFGGATSSEHVDGGTSRFDKRGIMHQAVCAGCGGRDDFPTTPGVWSNVNGSTSGCNNAVFKFDFQLPVTRASFTSPTIGCAPFSVSCSNTSFNASSYTWLLNGAPVSNTENNTLTLTNEGIYQIGLVAFNPETCNAVDTFYKYVRVVNSTSDVADPLSICLLDQPLIGPIFPIDPYYQATWSPSAGLSTPFEATTLASPSVSTEYTLLLSLETCADTLQYFIEVRKDSIDAGPDLNICRGQTVSLGNAAQAGNFTYQWSPSAFLSDESVAQPNAEVDASTVFTLLRIPLDTGEACPGIDSMKVIIPEGAPLADFETEIIASCTDIEVQINNTSELAESWSWNFNSGIGNSSLFSPQVTYQYGDTVQISLIVSNPVCRDTLNFEQIIDDLEAYFIVNESNAFSPNNDGVNDCFSPALLDLPEPDRYNFIPCSKLSIYDRWGILLWERNETADACWNGINDKGEMMPDGTYFFLFEGQGRKREGSVMLLR